VWRAVGERLPPAEYGEPAGDPELRLAVARYLGRARGIACAPQSVVITAGAIQACDLVARATLAPGDQVGFEEPGYPAARGVFLAGGAEVVPVAVDGDGLRVDELPSGADAPPLVYVTPSHQYPLGARLSFARRLALLEWARANDSLVVEDDYDSEFRFDAPPLPALAGLDEEGRVAYVGTFSKVLSPALRLGYLVVAPPLRERVERLKRLTDHHTTWPVQRALAEFVAGGHLERHVRRMRREYARKRAALLGALGQVEHLARPLGLEAGLHCCLLLRDDLDPDRVAALARERGVGVSTMDADYLGPVRRRGLLLGYGGLQLAEVERGAVVLAEALRQAAGPAPTPTASPPPGRAPAPA
jgi:GntR family transcriptional regulator/MocR family aminotransferase